MALYRAAGLLAIISISQTIYAKYASNVISYGDFIDDSIWDAVFEYPSMTQKCVYLENELGCVCKERRLSVVYLCEKTNGYFDFQKSAKQVFNNDIYYNGYYEYDQYDDDNGDYYVYGYGIYEEDLDNIKLEKRETDKHKPIGIPGSYNIDTKTDGCKPVDNTKCIDMAFHHIIPYNLLYTFWDTLIGDTKFTLEQKFRILDPIIEAIKYAMNNAKQYTFADDTAAEIKDLKQLFANMNKLETGAEKTPASLATGITDKVKVWRDLRLAIEWIPGNLFRGPIGQLRGKHDPGEKFEIHSENTIHKAAYDKFREVYDKMAAYVILTTKKKPGVYFNVGSKEIKWWIHTLSFKQSGTLKALEKKFTTDLQIWSQKLSGLKFNGRKLNTKWKKKIKCNTSKLKINLSGLQIKEQELVKKDDDEDLANVRKAITVCLKIEHDYKASKNAIDQRTEIDKAAGWVEAAQHYDFYGTKDVLWNTLMEFGTLCKLRKEVYDFNPLMWKLDSDNKWEIKT